jgi:hypothetical protein
MAYRQASCAAFHISRAFASSHAQRCPSITLIVVGVIGVVWYLGGFRTSNRSPRWRW